MTLARTRKTIDTKGVGAVMDAAEEAARREGHRVVIAVVDAGGTRLSGERLFAVVTPGFPDGLKVDRDGRVYASSFSGVQIFDPGGQLLGEIHLPGAVNFCFGGRERDLLLITTDSAVWSAALAAKGA